MDHKKYMAMIGKIGGSRATEAQRAAARKNGKRGGRPKQLIDDTKIIANTDEETLKDFP
jgi:hypothetical protein